MSFVIDPLWLAAVFLATVPVYLLLMRYSSWRLRPLYADLEEAFAAYASRQIDAITEIDQVRLVRLEALDNVTCMEHSARVIEAIEARADFNASGRGIRVAILDSGIDRNHPALLGKVVDEISTSGEAVNIPGNHGTHVAGTVASNDAVHRFGPPRWEEARFDLGPGEARRFDLRVHY